MNLDELQSYTALKLVRNHEQQFCCSAVSVAVI